MTLGYRGSSIAPIEFLTGDRSEIGVTRVSFDSHDPLARSIFKTGAAIVSGRGRWDRDSLFFVITEFCDVRPLRLSKETYRALEPPYIEPLCFAVVPADCTNLPPLSRYIDKLQPGVEIPFANAIVRWTSEGAVIVPAESLATAGEVRGRPLRALFEADACSCDGDAKLGRDVMRMPAATVSGRGYWHEKAQVFFISCICRVELAPLDENALRILDHD